MPPGDDPRLPFVVDVSGRFAPTQVRVRFAPALRQSTPALDGLIAEEWARQTALAEASGRMLFDGALLRYVDHAVLDESGEGGPRFQLTVGPTGYRDFVGTNLFNHHRLDEFGWERFANPIGTTATLITADGLLCFGLRSERVSYHARHVHTFGGGLEACDRAADGSFDPFASLSRELWEELGIARAELRDLCCVGLIRDREIHQPEMLFEARLELTAEGLRGRWQTAEGRDEHDALVSVPDEPGEIVPFIRGCDLVAPVAVGALLLHGRLRWGPGWYESAAEAIAGRGV